MKKIFVSQSAFRLARNRPQRTIERKMDNDLSMDGFINPIPILPKGIEFCEHAGTKYNCCKKPCFKKPDEYCGVREFRNKYE